ncbi:MAG: hypothetical protein CMI63_07805 [Parvularcula sp.]|nr:hypothetical protein [Parvularcula sp.]
MRMIMIAAALGLGATAATSAHAETYGKIFGGAVLGSDHDVVLNIDGFEPVAGEYDTDTGFVVGGAYGFNLSEVISLEGELAYRSNNVNSGVIEDVPLDGDGDINALSFMANAVVTAPSLAGFAPYAGAGAGPARVGGGGDHDLVFAWQAFGGVSRNITEKMSAGVEYRYFDAGRSTLEGGPAVLDTEYDAHSVNLVLKRSF